MDIATTFVNADVNKASATVNLVSSSGGKTPTTFTFSLSHSASGTGVVIHTGSPVTNNNGVQDLGLSAVGDVATEDVSVSTPCAGLGCLVWHQVNNALKIVAQLLYYSQIGALVEISFAAQNTSIHNQGFPQMTLNVPDPIYIAMGTYAPPTAGQSAQQTTQVVTPTAGQGAQQTTQVVTPTAGQSAQQTTQVVTPTSTSTNTEGGVVSTPSSGSSNTSSSSSSSGYAMPTQGQTTATTATTSPAASLSTSGKQNNTTMYLVIAAIAAVGLIFFMKK